MKRLDFICSALPPRFDAIGEYTALIASEVSRLAKVRILTGYGEYADCPGVTILPIFVPEKPRSVWRLVDQITANRPDWVVLQYNPFCYGRWGMNLHLPEAMKAVKRRSPSTKLAVMVHEPFVIATNWKLALMATWQRWQLWRLGRTADVIFFSIDPWAKRFQSWFPQTKVLHLPVGSNIPKVEISRQEARARLGIGDGTLVLCTFGSATHPTRLLNWVCIAAKEVMEAGQKVVILYIGPDGATVQTIMGDIPTITGGLLPPDEVSRRFAATDIYLAPFADGVCTRRGSLMTALQHGVAIVGTHGALTDAMLLKKDGRAFLLADDQNQNDFVAYVCDVANDANARDKMGREAQKLYEAEFAWPRISLHFTQALGMNN